MELTKVEKQIIEQYRAGAKIEITNFDDEFTYEEATDLVKSFGPIDNFSDVYHEYFNSHSIMVSNKYGSQVRMLVSFEG